MRRWNRSLGAAAPAGIPTPGAVAFPMVPAGAGTTAVGIVRGDGVGTGGDGIAGAGIAGELQRN